MNRRLFLQGMAGILAAGVAPAFVGSNILMPVRKIIVPQTIITPFSIGMENACSTPSTMAELTAWMYEIENERSVLRALLRRDKLMEAT